MMDLTFLGKKTQDDPPYAVFRAPSHDGDWTWSVTKTYQNDQSQQYARWMCIVTSPYTMGFPDMGDTYVESIISAAHATLVKVNGREPTLDELDEVAYLRQRVLARFATV